MTKQEKMKHIRSSEDKWTTVREYMEALKDSLVEECGFCEVYNPLDTDDTCVGCELLGEVCTDYFEKGKSLYWRIDTKVKELDTLITKMQLEVAAGVYKAHKKYFPKKVKGKEG